MAPTHYESQVGSPRGVLLASPPTCGGVRGRPAPRLLDWLRSPDGSFVMNPTDTRLSRGETHRHRVRAGDTRHVHHAARPPGSRRRFSGWRRSTSPTT